MMLEYINNSLYFKRNMRFLVKFGFYPDTKKVLKMASFGGFWTALKSTFLTPLLSANPGY